MTERLYYDDAALLAFDAEVLRVEGDGTRVELSRTAFYPTGGGQPHDTGTLDGVRVVDVLDEETRVVHVLERALAPGRTHVVGAVDAERRRDHTQQHTAQHLLSALLHDHYARPTVSFHLGAELSTIDLEGAPLTVARLAELERRVLDAITADHPVRVAVHDDAPAALRKATARSGPVRVVTIDGLDVNACGGTHVRSTGQLGVVLLRGVERVRDETRLSFVAGHRALALAQRDAGLLAQLSAAFDTTPAQATATALKQRSALAEAEKTIRALTGDLARAEGEARYGSTPADAAGRRVFVTVRSAAIDERVRATAQAFAAGTRALMVVASTDARTLLLVTSADSGVDAAALLKPLLAAEQGRGGGSATQAQGNVPDATAFARTLAALRAALGRP